jgi:hypothetical protein
MTTLDEYQKNEIHKKWMSVQERWSNDTHGTSQCQKILRDWYPILLERAEADTSNVVLAFERECDEADEILWNIRFALLYNVRGEVQDENQGTLWWIQDHHAVNSKPDNWSHFSPMNEKWLNHATASYLEKPWLQNNFIDWAIINASLFNELVELSNGLRSGQLLGKFNWAYLFSEYKLEKQQWLSVGFVLLGFLVRWVIPPAAVIALSTFNYTSAAKAIGGLWAVYILLRFVGLFFGWGERRALRKKVKDYTNMSDGLIALWVFTNTNVINPTRLREMFVEIDKRGEGYAVPSVVYSLVDRAIERDAAVFTHFFK